MDQLYPIEGPTTSSASQDFDFLNYWVDQSVEKEIHRGKQLRELKQRPILRKQKYDVINIGHTNVYCEKKLKRRSKSPHKSRKKFSKLTKKDSKSAQRCPMRIAELSVPSKRQCIDTWRNKHHVLPGIMIDRLRQHVLDLRPVVKIPDAIESFKIHKKVERKKKEIQQRKIKMAMKSCDCPKKKKVKPTKIQQCRYLCAIFGHKIAKELNKPARIVLNSELQMLSNIVSAEIEKLIDNNKRVKSTNFKNKRIQAEVAGKITIWLSNILEESAYKILEDQFKDLEEEVGPVLDLIDDLVDDVVDICEPEPEVVEVSSSSETFSTEHESHEEAKEGDTEEEEEELREEEYTSENLQFDFDSPAVPESTTKSLANLDDFVKNELDKIIDSFDQDDISVDIDGIAIEDETFTDTEDQPITIENQIEQNEFVDANDTLEVPIDETESQPKLDDLRESFQADQDTLITNEERTNIITEADDLINDMVSEDESNKKVKFSDIHMVTVGEIKEQSEKAPQHVNTEQFSAPNDHLLSDADESWPGDISLPFLRPSESASKSVTSLGKIMEEEERISVVIDYNRNTKDMTPDQNNISNDERDGVIDSSKPKKLAEQDVDKFKDVKIYLSEKNLIEQLETATDEDKYDTMESFTQKVPPQIEPTADKVEAGMENSSKENPKFELAIKEVIGQIIESIVEKGQAEFEPLTESADDAEKKDFNQLTPFFNDEDGLNYSNEQKDTELYSKFIIDKYGIIYIDGGIHSPSTDSTFPLDVPTETTEFALKLPKITEEQVIEVDKLKEGAKIEVEKGDTSRTHEDKIKTAEIGTNTSYTIIPRAEKSTSVSSQSLGDITKYLQVKKPDWFSSVRIKPKDYKVDQKSAPTWVSRNHGEPYLIPPKSQSKATNDKNIRLWCKDLENGFENLELWNGWLEKTVQSVKICEMKKARICLDKSREQFVRDWLLLKRNVDADVLTWTKLSKSTQDKMKAFRRIYHNFQTPLPSPGSKLGKSCNCHRQ